MAHIPPTVEEAKKRAKRKARATRPTIASIEVAPGRELAAHEANLQAYIKRTMELKRLGHYHNEVADIIATEYKLPYAPHITTIAKWYKQGMGAVREDIEELQWQIRLEAFNELEKMKAKWMAVATADHLEINRWKMVEGSIQPLLDENAIKEQLEATKRVVEIMARQARLLGLDLAQAINNKEGDGPANLQELQLWIIGNLNVGVANHAHGSSIDVDSEVLELKSGIPEVDSV